MTKIIDGKKIASEIIDRLRREVSKLSKKPRLAIITINADARSLKYVELKQQKASEIGVNVEIMDWSSLDLKSCIKKMRVIANNPEINGIIVQLPATGMGDIQKVLDEIPTSKDVDGLSTNSLGAVMRGQSDMIPATPKAILEILQFETIKTMGKRILIIGQGKLVGKPLAMLLKGRNMLVKTADSNTINLNKLCKSADVIISAVGKPRIINSQMLKSGAVVIDAGISEVGSSMVGDVDYDGLEGIASRVAKVPGGVGPVTVACLLENVVEATKNSQ